MYRCLSPGAIGVGASLEEGLRLAKLGEFEGLEVGIHDIAQRVEQGGAEAVRNLFAQAGIKAGGWGLPVDWRTDDTQKFVADLESLPRLAAAAQAIDCPRCSTWVLPFSDARDLEENIDWHISRFTPIAKILADHGCSLGLEFIGPKSMLAGKKYVFIRDMMEMVELGKRIGDNVGLLLDCWHWYTAGNTIEQLEQLTPDRVVYVHVNDAPTGIAVDEQIDSKRCMPGETGVIDIAGFLQALKKIGYDGPVTPEPFSEKVKGVTAEQAVTLTGESMKKIWRQAGLA